MGQTSWNWSSLLYIPEEELVDLFGLSSPPVQVDYVEIAESRIQSNSSNQSIYHFTIKWDGYHLNSYEQNVNRIIRTGNNDCYCLMLSQ